MARPSIQSLLVSMRFNGQQLATGTAFIVVAPSKRPYLITNRHNVTGRHQQTGKCLSDTAGVPNEVAIFHHKAGQPQQQVIRVEPLFDGNTPRWHEHPKLGSRADFVAMPLTQTTDIDIFDYDPANFGPDFDVGPADTVSVIGFPFGMSAGAALAVWATGFIASEPVIDYDGLPTFLIDCRSRKGQSGSPVIAYRGDGVVRQNGELKYFHGPVWKFLGIYSGRVNADSDLGIVWKTSAINELVLTL